MKYVLALLFFLASLIFGLSWKKPPVPKNFSIPYFDIESFQAKCNKEPPAWMASRYKKELEPFTKITQKSLDATFALFRDCVGPQSCARFRIINGNLYRLGEDPYDMGKFFKHLILLSRYKGMRKMPDVDFIICHHDATPLEFEPPRFWVTQDVSDQAPIFTYAKKKEDPYLISMPDRFTVYEWGPISQRILKTNGHYSWQAKEKSAFWRGQPNDFAQLGLEENRTNAELYKTKPRYLLCQLSAEFPTLIDAGFNSPGFSATNALIALIQPFNKEGMAQEEHLRWAYLPTIDGFTCTYPGFLWRLLSDSVAFKQQSEDSQWFYDALEPWVHYIPIKHRIEDLIDQIQWAKKHDALCEKIAMNATSFVKENLMIEDVYFYMFLVLEEYAKREDFQLSLRDTKNNSSWKKIYSIHK